VEHGEHDLDRRLALRLDDVDRDAAAVVDAAEPAVREQGDLDRRAVAGQGLVDRVVDHLVDEVVQAALAGGPDVHARALADRLEPLEDGDGAGVVLPAVGYEAVGRDPVGRDSVGRDSVGVDAVRRSRGGDRGRGGRRLVGHGSMGS
jgi:hypothetical protein